MIYLKTFPKKQNFFADKYFIDKLVLFLNRESICYGSQKEADKETS